MFYQKTTKEIDSVSLLLDLITLILSYVEIDKFKVKSLVDLINNANSVKKKAEKVDTYYTIVAKLAKAEDDALADVTTHFFFFQSTDGFMLVTILLGSRFDKSKLGVKLELAR